MTTNTQLELGLPAPTCRRRHQRRSTRVARAKWWFGKMREAVNNAIDCRTVPQPHAEQTWLAGTRRTIKI